jgi:hypothetical protein
MHAFLVMNTQHVSSDEIRHVIGECDDLLADRIASTGASEGEVAEAYRLYTGGENDEDLVERVSSPRVIEVRAILQEAKLDDDDDNDVGEN